jgi:hypothetical protein
MATVTATYFYITDQHATHLSQARRWQGLEVSSSGASPWRWVASPPEVRLG